jgi:putative tributyrin esterase
MAHLRCDFFSDALGLSTSMTVLLPQQTTGQIGMAGAGSVGPPPVLYLLHGLSDDDTVWLRRTSIERYVAELGWAVVMPQVHRSFYSDEVYGGRYWTFVSEELPALVADLFRVSTAREDTFVAGLSMGGYGAMKLALRQPERFVAAASLSGALALGERFRPEVVSAEDRLMFDRIFGPGGPVPPDADLLRLVADARPESLPALYAGCGTEDFLAGHQEAFVAACADAGVALTSSWSPGDHEWGFWDRTIRDVLAFFVDHRDRARADAG